MLAQTDNHTASLEGIREKFVCEYCDETFMFESSFDTHVRQHTARKKYKCQYCRKSFDRYYDLKVHIHIHTRERPCQYQYCPRACTTLCPFNNHVGSHIGENRHQCIFCQKSYGQFYDLKTHIREHIGEHPYKFEYCPKTVIHSSHAQTHFRKHTNNVIHECLYCRKSFFQLSELKEHTYIHTRERSNESPLCSESFAPSNNHTTHILKQHPFDRPHCQPSFPNESDVVEHVNTCTPGSWCSNAINVNYLPHPQSTPKPLDSSHINNHTRDNRLSGVNNVLTNNSDRYFTESGSLKEGIQTQTYVYPNNYPHCSDCLDTSNNLSRHIDRQQTFSSPHCQQSFLDQSYITEQIRTFTGRSDDYAPNRNHHWHLPVPALLNTSHVNRNVDDNGLQKVTVLTSNVVEDVRNYFYGNGNGSVRSVTVQQRNLSFTGSMNSLDIRLTTQTNANLTSNPRMIGLPQPPEQSLSYPPQSNSLSQCRQRYSLHRPWESSSNFN